MNSRSNVNESNLVNFPANLSNSTQLNQHRKEPLLSFPFDHLYACHSESSQRRQAIELDKEVEISTNCEVSEDKNSAVSPNSEVGRLTDQLTVVETQNRKLKDLLVCHLDLIQQQNDALTKKDKLYQALQTENETLKAKLNHTDKKTSNPKQTVTSQSLANAVPPRATSPIIKSEPNTSPQIMFDSLSDLLLPDTRTNPYIFNSDDSKDKVFNQDSFDLAKNPDADLSSFLPSDLELPPMSLLDANINCDNFTMIANKPLLTAKEIKKEPRPEPLYTVTTSSGNPIIQKIQRNRRRTSGGLGSLSRMPKKSDIPESKQIYKDDKKVERTFSLNKKCKMINTYGKSRTNNLKRTSQLTGSLSDRLRLIDTTPTGEDPYQLGEADMRENSPIPKLMLQKGSHRKRSCTSTFTGSSMGTRCIYDPAETETSTKVGNNTKVEDRYNMSSTYTLSTQIKTEPTDDIVTQEPVLDIVKTEPELHWSMYTGDKQGNEPNLCDFAYGGNPNNLATNLLTDLDSMDFPDFFASDSPLNLDNITPVDFNNTLEKKPTEKTKKRNARTTSLAGANADNVSVGTKRGVESKRGRKRAFSATGPAKGAKRDNSQKTAAPKPKIPRGKAACRGKKTPVPGMMTRKTYHTLMGDPDLSWYLGLDPDVKLEDVDPPGMSKTSTVEVPRWREKPYTSCYTLEGTENLNDKVFEKRHHKLEADERRQLRWHMRRIREQRHVERLRLRQRDPWCGKAYQTHPQPSDYTIWPQPQRDIRVIEITDILPVMAFGESVPELPEVDFKLPWVRTSKAMKRSKRSKTLH